MYTYMSAIHMTFSMGNEKIKGIMINRSVNQKKQIPKSVYYRLKTSYLTTRK